MRWFSPLLLLTLLAPLAVAQALAPARAPAGAVSAAGAPRSAAAPPAAAKAAVIAAAKAEAAKADATRQKLLQQLLALSEPGEQRRGLEAFLHEYPQAPERDEVYAALIQDASQLGDARGVLTYNEKLEALDPDDLGQRIKTINLLLLETDHADELRAQQDAATFARQVAEEAAQPAPTDMSAAEWQANLNRMRALAGLFQGAAAQSLRQFPAAERYFAASLRAAQTEEAAQHLAEVQQDEHKLNQAVTNFALALSLPGDTIAARDRLRLEAGTLYAQLHHGSQAGFGDLILHEFDLVAARDAREQAALDGAGANAHAGSAGAFVLESLDGRTHKLADYAGKVVVVDFWATWCQPCQIEHPLYAAVRRKFAKDHNVIFLAVNEDADRAAVGPYLAAHHWSRTTWLDAGLADYLGVDALPTTLIFGPRGAVVYRQDGLTPATFATELTQAVRQELARAFPAKTAAN